MGGLIQGKSANDVMMSQVRVSKPCPRDGRRKKNGSESAKKIHHRGKMREKRRHAYRPSRSGPPDIIPVHIKDDKAAEDEEKIHAGMTEAEEACPGFGLPIFRLEHRVADMGEHHQQCRRPARRFQGADVFHAATAMSRRVASEGAVTDDGQDQHDMQGEEGRETPGNC